MKFGFRITSIGENLENLRKIVDIVRAKRGDVPIVFTLSPVPLNATFREISCISANSVSKAILRVAVDELMRERANDGNLYYFPSYEMVTSYFKDPWGPDRLHPTYDTVDTIMRTFARLYAVEE